MAKYLDFTGLSYYDTKIKSYIDTADGTLNSSINSLSSSKQDKNKMVGYTGALTLTAEEQASHYPSVQFVMTLYDMVRNTAEGKTDTIVITTTNNPANRATGDVTTGDNVNPNWLFQTTNQDVVIGKKTESGTSYWAMLTSYNSTSHTYSGEWYSVAANSGNSGDFYSDPSNAEYRISLDNLRTGDIILLTDVDFPDRWFEKKEEDVEGAHYVWYIFHKLETRSISLDNYLLSSTAQSTYVKKTFTVNSKALSGTGITLNGTDLLVGGTTTASSSTIENVLSGHQTSIESKIAKSVLTTKGDIIYASAANTPARLAIGTSGQVLKVSSSGIPEWSTDNNTAHSHSVDTASGLTVSGAGGISGTVKYALNFASDLSTPTAAATANAGDTISASTRLYPVRLDKDNKVCVYVPWTDEQDTAIPTTNPGSGTEYIDYLFPSA